MPENSGQISENSQGTEIRCLHLQLQTWSSSVVINSSVVISSSGCDPEVEG